MYFISGLRIYYLFLVTCISKLKVCQQDDTVDAVFLKIINTMDNTLQRKLDNLTYI